ncbi:MAG: hypothetical protein PHN88_07730 [Ignavibacteria bacterium]|nr:hypothetical protein [Ignavibacteria bacterium]
MNIKYITAVLLMSLAVIFYLGTAGAKNTQKDNEPKLEIQKEIESTPEVQTINIDTFKSSLSSYGKWVKVKPEEVDPETTTSDNVDPESTTLTDEVSYDEDMTETDLANLEAASNAEETVVYDENTNVGTDVSTDYIWVPDKKNINDNWTPYTNGRWEWTNYGWMWASDYQWGRVTYHYGRWWYSERYGWVWSPGYRWAPAWVYWSYSNEYTGWHPIGPRRHHYEWNQWNHNNGNWNHNGNHHIVHNGWVFVNNNNFTSQINSSTVINRNRNLELLKKTKDFTSLKKTENGITNPGISLSKNDKVKNNTNPIVSLGNNGTRLPNAIELKNSKVTKNTKQENVTSEINNSKNANVTKEINNTKKQTVNNELNNSVKVNNTVKTETKNNTNKKTVNNGTVNNTTVKTETKNNVKNTEIKVNENNKSNNTSKNGNTINSYNSVTKLNQEKSVINAETKKEKTQPKVIQTPKVENTGKNISTQKVENTRKNETTKTESLNKSTNRNENTTLKSGK